MAPATNGDYFDAPAFSGDGSSLVFTSRADVIPGHAAHTAANVYLYDLASGRTTAVTAGTAAIPFLSDSDSFGAAISGDGRTSPSPAG